MEAQWQYSIFFYWRAPLLQQLLFICLLDLRSFNDHSSAVKSRARVNEPAQSNCRMKNKFFPLEALFRIWLLSCSARDRENKDRSNDRSLKQRSGWKGVEKCVWVRVRAGEECVHVGAWAWTQDVCKCVCVTSWECVCDWVSELLWEREREATKRLT